MSIQQQQPAAQETPEKRGSFLTRLTGRVSLSNSPAPRASVVDEPSAEDLASREIVVASVEPPTHEELRIGAKVCGAEAIKDASGSAFIAYTIIVTTGVALTWRVQRRFREFESLHKDLCDKFGEDRLPSLPKKSLTRNTDPASEYIRKKKTELSKYITDLALDPNVVASEPLAHFLLSNIQDIVRANVTTLREVAQRDKQLKTLEAQAVRQASEMRRKERAQDEAAKAHQAQIDEMQAQIRALEEAAATRVKAAEESATVANNEVHQLHQAHTDRFEQLLSATRELKAEKKTALKCVRDLEALVQRLKAEKKMLVRECKQNRAQLAALGVLGLNDESNVAAGITSDTASNSTQPSNAASVANSGKSSPTGMRTPNALHSSSVHGSPIFSPSASHQLSRFAPPSLSLSFDRQHSPAIGAHPSISSATAPESPLTPSFQQPGLQHDSSASSTHASSIPKSTSFHTEVALADAPATPTSARPDAATAETSSSPALAADAKPSEASASNES